LRHTALPLVTLLLCLQAYQMVLMRLFD